MVGSRGCRGAGEGTAYPHLLSLQVNFVAAIDVYEDGEAGLLLCYNCECGGFATNLWVPPLISASFMVLLLLRGLVSYRLVTGQALLFPGTQVQGGCLRG